MGQFLSAVRDPDMNVRRVAIVTLNSAAHNKPRLVSNENSILTFPPLVTISLTCMALG